VYIELFLSPPPLFHMGEGMPSLARWRARELLAPLQGAIFTEPGNPGRCPGLVCIGAFSAESAAMLSLLPSRNRASSVNEFLIEGSRGGVRQVHTLTKVAGRL
jgi:hypothetical protein